MGIFSAFEKDADGALVFDNTRRIARIAYLLRYYATVATHGVGRIMPSTAIRRYFPFQMLRHFDRPSNLTVEFTNYCNLRCTYCTSPLGIRTRGMMSADTFELLLQRLNELPIARLRVVGNGEPTLHPNFSRMIRRLARNAPYLQLVTNGQRLTPEFAEAILTAPVRLLEISADASDKSGYERSRVGGKFERLTDGLKLIMRMKRELGAPTLVNIRAMIRPSQREHEANILRFWSAFADTVMPQYVHDYTQGLDSDVFAHRPPRALIPRCALPANDMIMHFDGSVPLCELSQRQTDIPGGLIVGNIHEQDLSSIWNAPLMRQYRLGHQKRRHELTPICAGCVGG